MARIVVDAYVIRCPLGGVLSWAMQYILGFQKLGHEVYFVERSEFSNACYDPVRMQNTDDCTYGVATVAKILERFGLGAHWCFIDIHGTHFGLSKERITEVFKTADLLVDLGPHGAWLDHAADAGQTVLVDAEPGFTQMRWEKARRGGAENPRFDHYYTIGQNIGTPRSPCPDAGLSWGHLFQPVVTDLFEVGEVPEHASFTTVMNWQSHEEFDFEGVTYSQKDREFERFIDLPSLTTQPLEIAVSKATQLVRSRIQDRGWHVQSGQAATMTIDDFYDHVRRSRGEFSVSKHVFVATNSGWFSDRSAVYLACGRPVVLQDTGFSEHLPCGAGLFAVRTVGEAVDAINQIQRDYKRHSQAARDIAVEHLDASRVLSRFLEELTV